MLVLPELNDLKPMATTKKIVNSVSTCVDDNIAGFLCLHPGLCQLQCCPRVIVRADLEQYKASNKVTLMIGGGSGHEPTFAGEGVPYIQCGCLVDTVALGISRAASL